jgi:flagellar motor switch/type III secretory pathway protein FliN
MPLTPELADSILSTCQQGAAEAAEALSRALDATVTVAADAMTTDRFAGAPPEWSGPGLMIVLRIDQEAVLLLLPEASGLLPEWCKAPDATGTSKLTTLAQELGMILLPEEHMPYDFAARHVERLADAVARGGVGPGAGIVRLEIAAGETQAPLTMLWPALRPEGIFAAPKVERPTDAARSAEEKRRQESDEELEERLQKLPSYVRSLLKIQVPVSVMLASTKQPVSRILNIGPGSIIQFDKHCEHPLTLCIGDQSVAEGEAVKVGEKFGIKITSMVLPGERFFALRGQRQIRRAS